MQKRVKFLKFIYIHSILIYRVGGRNMIDIIKSNKYLYLYFLVVLLVICAVKTPTYAKFSDDYVTEDDAVGITFDFSLNISDIEEYKSINIDAYGAKIFNIKVSNNTPDTIYYGAWYRMVEPKDKSDDIVIAKLSDSASSTSGSVLGNDNSIISVIIKNKTNKKIKVDFGVASSDKDANSIEYLSGKRLISGTDDINYLNEVETGSFVEYVGSNGCTGNSCRGENANYVNGDNKGYCYSKDSKIRKIGWQVAYIEEKIVYLISAGSLECVSTGANGSISFNKKLDNFEQAVGTPKHITNLNTESLKYCNEDFVIDGECNGNTVWAFNASDFTKINNMPVRACYKNHSESCDGFDDIITNSGYYWIANKFDDTNTNYYWDGIHGYVYNSNTSNSLGIRPVIKMDPSIYIVDGDGSSNNPYKIANEVIRDDK